MIFPRSASSSPEERNEDVVSLHPNNTESPAQNRHCLDLKIRERLDLKSIMKRRDDTSNAVLVEHYVCSVCAGCMCAVFVLN